MKLPNFTRLLHGVCEHNTKILFFFLNLDAVLSVSTPESFGNMWHIYEFEGKQLFLALNTIFTFPTPLPSPPELRNFRSYSKFLSPHPPPHFYCLPSTTKTIESINVNGGEGGRTIEMWWCWKLVKLDRPPINSTWNYLYEDLPHFIHETKTKSYDNLFLRKVRDYPAERIIRHLYLRQGPCF